MSTKRQQTHRVEVHVVEVLKNGWAKGRIERLLTENTSHGRIPSHGDRVAIPKSIHVVKGENAIASVIKNTNGKTSHLQPWFMTYRQHDPLTIEPQTMKWSPWQDSDDALVLRLPSTKPGSDHCGIDLACWKCGHHIASGQQIFCIRNGCIWTDPIRFSGHLQIDSNRDYNDIKKCYVQKTRCDSCESIVGSFYAEPYHGCDEKKRFPCFKIITAWERRKWRGDKPLFATVLTGSKAQVESSIEKLEESDDWEIEKHFQVAGRRDKEAYLRMEEAKAALMVHTQKEVEQRIKEAEALAEEAVTAAKEIAAEAEKRVSEAEALAATKEAEAKAATARAHEVESRTATNVTMPPTKSIRSVYECCLGGSWQEYPTVVCSALDAGLRDRRSVTFALHGHKYKIDFSKTQLVQVNISTKKERAVRRTAVEYHGATTSDPDLVWECNLDNHWAPYPEDVVKLLESSYHRRTKARFCLGNIAYEVDFNNDRLEQVNVESGFRREIRRQRVFKTLEDGNLTLPKTWSNNASNQNCTLISLNKDSSEWTMVESELRKTLSNRRLVKVVRVQNILLWNYFTFQQRRVAKLSDKGDANVIRVWHGTREVNPNIICTDEADGFMMQHSRKGTWGQGIYFAANASYSHGYAYHSISSSRASTIILARLVAGDEIEVAPNASLRLCPEKNDGRGRYHTVTGRTGGSKVYIVYENGRAYPEYLVTYV